MTMPTLIQKQQNKEIISRAKTVYADINHAFLASQNDYGVIGNNGLLFNETDNSINVSRNLIKYLNGAKLCETKTQEGCSTYYYDIKYASIRFDNNNVATVEARDLPKIIFPNGAVLSLSSNQSGCEEKTYSTPVRDKNGLIVKNEDGTDKLTTYQSSICANLFFDVNGPKLPNQFGHDSFSFWVYKDKLVPASDYVGGKSLKNILTGKDKLEYKTYSKGQSFEF